MTVPHMPGRAYLVPGFRTYSLLRDDHLRTGILLAVSPDISGSGTLLGDGTHMEVFPRVERPRGEHGLRASSSGATRDARAVVIWTPSPHGTIELTGLRGFCFRRPMSLENAA